MKRMRIMVALGWVLVFLAGCRPDEGPGGQGEIRVTFLSQSTPVGNARLYIKYDATASPGTDTLLYDDSAQIDSLGFGRFSGLYKGDYFLWAKGYDPVLQDTVAGGMTANLPRNNELISIVIQGTP